MRKMECTSCGCVTHFEITCEVERSGMLNSDGLFYCPICSSVEESVEVSSIEGGA